MTQLEKDLALIGRYIADSQAVQSYSFRDGEYCFETGCNPCGSGPTMGEAIHNAAVAIGFRLKAEYRERLESTLAPKALLGDWTEGE